MRTDTFTTEPIISLLHRQSVASLIEISAALGSPSHRTVCRKLAKAGCRSSYSHCGRYYTLDELACYDEHGLWHHNGIHFSTAGSLMQTAQVLVSKAPAGRFAAELTSMVGVDTQDVLRKLVADNRLHRTQIDGCFLYCTTDGVEQRKQLRARQILRSGGLPQLPDDRHVEVQLSAASATLFNLLDERQRRLFAGLESLRIGHGGDRRVADSFGLSPTTVASGRKQLLEGDFDPNRIRKPGGGRKAVEKKRLPHRIDHSDYGTRHGWMSGQRTVMDTSNHTNSC